MHKVHTQTLGFPRIGRDREMKRAVEAFWKGVTDEAGLWEAFQTVEAQSLSAQLEAGIDRIGVGDVTLYDHVLDWAIRLGLIPSRFRHLRGVELTFAMARGLGGSAPLELTKWFDTNYHYLVPEIEADVRPRPDFESYLSSLSRAQAQVGDRAVPILLGPITLLELSSLQQSREAALEAILPLYRELLEELVDRGFVEAQLHEPALVMGTTADLQAATERAYASLARAGMPLNLVTTFDDLGESFGWVSALPLATLTLDFTRGDTLSLIRKHGWPEGVTLGAGIVDGRNIWRIRPAADTRLLGELADLAPLCVGASCSLMFVPYSAAREAELPDALRGVLAFADEKLDEIQMLRSSLAEKGSSSDLETIEAAWANLSREMGTEEALRVRIQGLTSESFARESAYDVRRAHQVQLPPFPTTTIGSFPQTGAVRRLRAQFKRGEIDEGTYHASIDAWIGYAIGVQEGLGLDVLVHGEFERSDMVEYFAEKLEGFAFTQFGWVQSYGNRYVRPPIIWADVRRLAPMTVREFKVAQSFTDKPVKGMLTGPVTILNWSFPRVDISRKELAFQIALALRGEIADLEDAGARVIQVDEPALREGLPLKPEAWGSYLDWAVDAFRLTTAGARAETQIHTHMCYAEFGDILQAIDQLDADVMSIENIRSGDANLNYLAEAEYGREVGPGVYDVHSRNIPEPDAVRERLGLFVRHLRPEQIWVNPDCGLKTRAWDDVLPSLANIVQAAREMRGELSAQPERALAGD